MLSPVCCYVEQFWILAMVSVYLSSSISIVFLVSISVFLSLCYYSTIYGIILECG